MCPICFLMLSWKLNTIKMINCGKAPERVIANNVYKKWWKNSQWFMSITQANTAKTKVSLSDQACDLYYSLGCGRCWTVDGNWKLNFPHCMYPVRSMLESMPSLNVPDVCSNQPVNSETAFCFYHCELAKRSEYPTTVRQFLNFCKKDLCELFVILMHIAIIYFL